MTLVTCYTDALHNGSATYEEETITILWLFLRPQFLNPDFQPPTMVRWIKFISQREQAWIRLVSVQQLLLLLESGSTVNRATRTGCWISTQLCSSLFSLLLTRSCWETPGEKPPPRLVYGLCSICFFFSCCTVPLWGDLKNISSSQRFTLDMFLSLAVGLRLLEGTMDYS